MDRATLEQAVFFVVWTGAWGWRAWLQVGAVIKAFHTGSVRTRRAVGRVVYRSLDAPGFQRAIAAKSIWGLLLIAMMLLPLVAWAMSR
jgi:hypothetical protein